MRCHSAAFQKNRVSCFGAGIRTGHLLSTLDDIMVLKRELPFNKFDGENFTIEVYAEGSMNRSFYGRGATPYVTCDQEKSFQCG